jgi:hypothetical protein
MMFNWKSRRTWVGLLALFCVALAAFFEPTHYVRGWLWGEAFFDGRPTSYWRGVLEADLSDDDLLDMNRAPSRFESVCEKCGLRTRRQKSNVLITPADSEAVLAELRQDRSPRVRALARAIIDFNTNELPQLLADQMSCGTDVLVKLVTWNRAVHNARLAPGAE